MKPVFVCQQTPHEPSGRLGEFLDASGVPWILAHLYYDNAPAFDPAEHAGLVVLGGSMNALEDDRFPFLAREAEWLREAVAQQVPVLGICLGSQLLARALGARVYRNPQPEIGWTPIQLTAEGTADPLLGSLDTAVPLFQWHSDTFDLPPGAVHLARSRDCKHQAFRVGEHAYGLQFHPEVTRTIVEDWLSSVDESLREVVLQQTDSYLISQTKQAMPLFQRWLAFVSGAGE